MTLADGRVMVVGGDSNSELRSTEIFDSSSGTWMSAGVLGTGRLYPAPTLLVNGKVLAAGGSDEYGRAYAGADLYDPVRNLWKNIGSLNVARSNHTATLLPDGSVLIAGGYGPSGTYLRSAEIFQYLRNR